ncbi:MAG: hypothetical protein LBE70_05430 [Nitrososphaerota archaeon]|jgi:hypothetical protein|nr:hypothetical protein [Nitrososphaerota archaeon]
MKFDFDNYVNIKTTATPVKPLIDIIDPNENINARLWIADENAEICRWKKDSVGDYLNTIPYNNKNGKENEKIGSDRVVVNTRMLILQRSVLLKVEAKLGSI